MLTDFPLQFEHPGWLLLLLLIIPIWFIGRLSAGAQSRIKATFVFALRVIVILLLTVALTHPTWVRRGEGLTVTTILDRSFSIPLSLKDQALAYLQEAAKAKTNPEDRIASIVVGKEATITAMPDSRSIVTIGLDEGDRSATNLAAGIRLALAIMPDDTANRIVMVSDGNETIDSVLAAAELARANNVPIDVLLLEYDHRQEVIFDRLVAPARARMGQTVTVRLVLRSQNAAEGTVFLRMNGEPLDLDPEVEGTGMRVTLEPGVMAIPVTLRLDDSGPIRFEATFEPDDLAMDTIVENNRAVGVTFVSGEGRVLIVEDGSGEVDNLAQALIASSIAVDRRSPEALADGLVLLSGYDAVVLANVPRWMFDDQQDRMLHAYVHDLGGGLVMLGGPQSFGAGGWIDSQVAKVLPVKLDPPQTRQMPRGALALIMHSCEMPQGNYWGREVARAGINALSRLDYVGIIDYDWNRRDGIMGAGWAFPMQLAGDKKAALAATETMVVGDTKDFGPLMQVGFDGLSGLRAGQKHAIIITDGDPQAPPVSLMKQYIDNKITVTTVMVIGHGSAMDRQKLQNMADQTGGRFYNVQNPNQLPQIFIKEAQMISRSLIQEGELYQPQVVSRLPGPTEGFAAVPAVEGYVLTAQRDGLAQLPIVLRTTEGDDPIYAHWNYGLGKSIAYTSDLAGRWGTRWASWSEFMAFWSQSIRWVMRPSSPSNMVINTRTEGDLAVVDVEALESDASFLNFLQTRGVVIRPDGQADPLSLQQVGPGRYRGEFPVDDTGAYLVNINYSSGVEAEDAGNIQAAVTMPYSREFRATTHNAALLRQLAEMTGGRVLASNLAPQDVDLFHRETLAVPKTPKQIWDLLAIIAASLFLIDVAVRRLAVDYERLRKAMRRATGSREPVGGATVAAWQRAREQVTHRRGTEESKPAKATDRTVKYEASEEDAGTAIDVAGEQTQEPGSPRSATPSRQEVEESPRPEDEGPHTSRLLRAKRRAQQQKPDDATREDDNEQGGGA